MNYEDTKIEKKGNICFFIICVILLYFIISIIIKYITGEFSYKILFLLIILIPVLTISIYFPFINIKNVLNNRKIVKNIIENGKKLKGTIIKIEGSHKSDYNNSLFKNATYYRRQSISLPGRSSEFYDYAVVEYKDNGETKRVNTPSINFYEEDLKGKDVDVYILNDKVYVDNFILKREKTSRHERENKKMTIKTVIAFIIMIILLGIVVLLNNIGIIPSKFIPVIILSIMFAYFIYASIVSIKYVDKTFGKDNKDKEEDKKKKDD